MECITDFGSPCGNESEGVRISLFVDVVEMTSISRTQWLNSKGNCSLSSRVITFRWSSPLPSMVVCACHPSSFICRFLTHRILAPQPLLSPFLCKWTISTETGVYFGLDWLVSQLSPYVVLLSFYSSYPANVSQVAEGRRSFDITIHWALENV